MKKLLTITIAAILLVGCVTMNPETRSAKFTVDMPFDVAYSRAVQTFATLGGSITSQDSKSGTVAATVHNALNMTATLNRLSDTQTEVSIWGSTIPGKIIVGTFTEVDDYQRIFTSGK